MNLTENERRPKRTVSDSSRLSVIIPFCDEWPQIAFTVRAIHEELTGIPHEIVVVDNWCEEVANQGREPDRGHTHMVKQKDGSEKEEKGALEAQAARKDWLTYVRYDEKLSHWCAKNAGMKAARGDTFLFVDAHCVPSRGSIDGMYDAASRMRWDCSVHLPLTYHILEDKWLIYKPVRDPGYWAYTFSSFPGEKKGKAEVFEVPVMSTCGMLLSRRLAEHIMAWPDGLGIYGGGENYVNYVMAAMDLPKYIWCGGVLHHHGSPRGYSQAYDDTVRNRALAMYCVGGDEALDAYIDNTRGRPAALYRIRESARRAAKEHRRILEPKLTQSLEDWWQKWNA